MNEKTKKTLGAGVLSLALVIGVAGFAGASSGTIGTTGPDSQNEISHESSVELDFDNDNDLDVSFWGEQEATSGDARASHNTTAGDARTGNTSNASSVSATLQVENHQTASGFDGLVGNGGNNTGSINNTGPDSENEVTFRSDVDVDVNNDNDIELRNKVEQEARSGDARVSGNTTGGSAVSGSASNTSTSSFTVRVTN